MRCTPVRHLASTLETGNRVNRPTTACIVLVLAALVPSCADGPAASGDDRDEATALEDARADTVPAVRQAGPEDAPQEVYFDLTGYEWYRQAQPLMHGGRQYRPQGDPVAIALDSLEQAGRYQEVDYYVRSGAQEPFYTLYVPVYYRYWQRFVSPPAS